jgi:hypothetical protein
LYYVGGGKCGVGVGMWFFIRLSKVLSWLLVSLLIVSFLTPRTFNSCRLSLICLTVVMIYSGMLASARGFLLVSICGIVFVFAICNSADCSSVYCSAGSSICSICCSAGCSSSCGSEASCSTCLGRTFVGAKGLESGSSPLLLLGRGGSEFWKFRQVPVFALGERGFVLGCTGCLYVFLLASGVVY